MKSDPHQAHQLAALTENLKVRIAHLQKYMEASSVEALLVSSNTNLYYTAGKIFRGYVYIPAKGDAITLAIRPAVEADATHLNIRKPEMIVEALSGIGVEIPQTLALEFDTLTHSEYTRLQKCFEGKTLVNGSALLRNARMIKTDYEIERMREDGVHQTAAYERITGLYREGMTDIELQIEIEKVLRLEGLLGFLRTSGSLMEINMGSLLAGDNADTPSPYEFSMGGEGVDASLPVGANGTLLKPGMAVMVDMNGNFNGYQTDLTRVWAIGELPELAVTAHNASLEILHTLEKEGRPGVAISHLCELAYGIVAKHGLEKYFMGHNQQVGFIGHGVGIELNEGPVIMLRNKSALEENMTIAIEPKFVIPGVGAVGAENTYLVTPNGLENLTPFPEEILQF